MPELPEVHTTATMLDSMIRGLRIVDVWSDYDSPHYHGKPQIKDPAYFRWFKKKVRGTTFVGSSRRAKNVLLHLDNGFTILVHMKMTGHLLYGEYVKQKPKVSGTVPAKNDGKPNLETFASETWRPAHEDTLADPWNRWIHVVFTLDNGKHLVLSDLRKFAKVTLIETARLDESDDLKNLGPEPLDDLDVETFRSRMMVRSGGNIKTVLMDQTVIVGVGNIYSDEALWLSKIHPETKVGDVPTSAWKTVLKYVRDVLREGLKFGGSSESDYRAPDGTRGLYQTKYRAYRRTGKACRRTSCAGTITRTVVGGRSAHFCSVCQRGK